ncbi:hypothetical protein [Microbacterium oxydans]|uniref:DUF559 domain-containing protein n=1 Tax=Microbacterium oxydans TaxID=82380 RepID=A0A0F0L7X1_9MICO|nr:hypothetical protein [Microbacterium oxydans]KJL29282.1 hypothetical protein RS83_01911 [Microbacterium oxydans]
MPIAPRPLPAALGPHFSVAQAARVDVSRRRLRAKDLEAPFHGARRAIPDHAGAEDAEGEPLAIDRALRARVVEDARSYSTVMPAGSFFCGRTAAVLFGAPIDHERELEVAVIAPRRAPRGRGIRGSKVAANLVSVRVHDGLPVASPASTWAMLCRELTTRQLVVLGDALVRIPRDRFGRQHPESVIAIKAELRAALEAGPRPPGTTRLSAALDRVRIGSSSPLETEFRLDAEDQGLPTPRLDSEIRARHGQLLGISEFAYPRFRTVVEVEGDHHRTSRKQWDRDLAKYRDYADAGWEVVRLASRNIRGVAPDAVSIVRRVLLRRGWDGA